MTIRNSTGLRDAKAMIGQARALAGGIIELRTLTQPDTADSASAGTVLGIITKNGGPHTNEVQATGSVQLTAGTTGNTMTALTVNSVEILGATITYSVDLPTTAALIVAQINRYQTKGVEYSATSDGAAQPTITIKPSLGIGATANSWVVASSVTGFSKTDTNMSGGVSSVNGLTFEGASGGMISRNINETWTLTWLAAGTISHFRMKGPLADNDAATTTLVRKDGTVGVSGADFIVSSTTVTSGMVGQTAGITTFSITEPAQ